MKESEVIKKLESADSYHRQEQYDLDDEAIHIAVESLKKQIPLPLRRKYTNGTGVCDECGQVVKLYDKYCSYCGHKLDT